MRATSVPEIVIPARLSIEVATVLSNWLTLSGETLVISGNVFSSQSLQLRSAQINRWDVTMELRTKRAGTNQKPVRKRSQK